MRNLLYPAFISGAGAITLLAFLLFVHSLLELYREEARSWRNYFGVALASVLGAAFAFGSVAIDFKVLSDETNLLSVANMLIQFGKASNTEMWTHYYGTFHALDVNVPTRPLLFPLLTALVHGVNGMRWWSPFVVNFLCLSALFFLALSWARRRLAPGLYPATLAWLALAMSPVLLINATSAGFDLCSLVFGVVSALLLVRHFSERGDDRSERALLFALVCYASVRYESIVALALVGAALLVRRRGRALPWSLYGTAGFLLLPLFIQRYLTWGSFENPAGVAPFSLSHLVNHLRPFLEAFFLDARGPYPILLHWLGLAGLVAFLPRAGQAGKLLLAYGFFLTALLLAHHFGFAGHPTQTRLFLTPSIGLTLLALYFVNRVREAVDGRALVGVFAILLYHHHQYAVSDPLTTQLTMTREVHHLRDFVANEGAPGDLWVYDRPGQLSALGLSAISQHQFRDNTQSYLENLGRGLYQRILVVERVSYPEGKAKEPVTGPFSLVPLRLHQLTPEERLQIARLDAGLRFPLSRPGERPVGAPKPVSGPERPRL